MMYLSKNIFLYIILQKERRIVTYLVIMKWAGTFQKKKKVEKNVHNDQIYTKPELNVDSGGLLALYRPSLSPLWYTKDVAIAAIDGGIAATATATVTVTAASLPRTPFTALVSVRCCLSSAVDVLESSGPFANSKFRAWTFYIKYSSHSYVCSSYF